MPPALREGINLNTVLLGVVLALSGWTLNRVASLSEQMAGGAVTDANQARELADLRIRISSVEAQIQANSIEIAHLQKR